MDLVVVGYVIYVALGVSLAMWVAKTLSRQGRTYLADVFQNEKVGAAMNQLLVVGFYLVNFGFMALWLRTGDQISTLRDLLQMLSIKIGTVLLVIGALHLINLLIFSRIRRNTLLEQNLRQAAHPVLSDAARD